jgi:hypothetical protein
MISRDAGIVPKGGLPAVTYPSCEKITTVYGPMPISPEQGSPSAPSFRVSTSGVG